MSRHILSGRIGVISRKFTSRHSLRKRSRMIILQWYQHLPGEVRSVSIRRPQFVPGMRTHTWQGPYVTVWTSNPKMLFCGRWFFVFLKYFKMMFICLIFQNVNSIVIIDYAGNQNQWKSIQISPNRLQMGLHSLSCWYPWQLINFARFAKSNTM